MPAPQPFWLKVQIGPLLHSRPFVAGGTPRTHMEVRSGVSAFAAAIWSWDENERLRVQQVCSGATEAGQLFSDSLCLAAHNTCFL